MGTELGVEMSSWLLGRCRVLWYKLRYIYHRIFSIGGGRSWGIVLRVIERGGVEDIQLSGLRGVGISNIIGVIMSILESGIVKATESGDMELLELYYLLMGDAVVVLAEYSREIEGVIGGKKPIIELHNN